MIRVLESYPGGLRAVVDGYDDLSPKWISPVEICLNTGGKAAYPSSVLMNAILARMAGIGRVAMAVPTPEGVFDPLVFAAARLAGVDDVYRIGGTGWPARFNSSRMAA